MEQLLFRSHPGHVLIEEVGAPPQTRRVRIQVKFRSRCTESNPRQKMVLHHPPGQVPSRFPWQRHRKRWRVCLEGPMRLEMPLQRAHPKATVRNQPLERSQVTEDHLKKAEPGESPWNKSSPPPTGISRLAPETEKPCRLQYRWSYRGT